MTIENEIEKLLSNISVNNKIKILTRLAEKYKLKNSMEINDHVYGRKIRVDQRTDEIHLKNG